MINTLSTSAVVVLISSTELDCVDDDVIENDGDVIDSDEDDVVLKNCDSGQGLLT